MPRLFMTLVALLAAVACVTATAVPSPTVGPAAAVSTVLASSPQSPAAPRSSHSSLSFYYENDPSTVAYIQTRYGSSGQVAVVRSAIPRWGRTDKFDPRDSEYQMEVIFTVAPGAALFIVTLLMWIVWSAAVCCCCKPNPAGYSRRQIQVPMIAGVFCSLVVVAFSIVGLLMTERFDSEITGSSGVGQTTLNILDHVNNFFTRLDTNLGNVTWQADRLAPNIKAKLDTFTDLGNGLPQLLADIHTFSNDVGALNPIRIPQADPGAEGASATKDFSCQACTSVQDTINSAANQMDRDATPLFNQVESTKAAALEEVADAVPQIEQGVNDAKKQIADVKDQAQRYNKDVYKYKNDYVDKWEKVRRAVVIAIYSLPIFAVVCFFAFTLGARSEGCTKVLAHLMFFVGCLMWIMFLIHLPASLVVADACHYLDLTDPNLGTTSLDDDITRPLTACLAQTSLLVALNATRYLDFTNTVIFPTVPDVSSLLNLTTFTSLDATVGSLTLDTFNWPQLAAQRDDALAHLNAETAPFGQIFSLANVTLCNYTDYDGQSSVKVRSYRNVILTLVNAEGILTEKLVTIQSNMTGLTTEMDTLVGRAETLLNVDLPQLKGVIQPVLDAGQRVVDQALCTPLDQDYLEMKETFCKRMIVSISGLAMASFFVAIFIWFLNVCCWFLMYRLQHAADKLALPVGVTAGTNTLYGVGGADGGVPEAGTGSPLASPSEGEAGLQSPNSQAHFNQGAVPSEGVELASAAITYHVPANRTSTS